MIRAREAGGIFSGIPQDEKGETSSAPMEDVISGSLENRLGEIERRIRLMEDVVGGMGQRVDNLVQKKNERDTIVLELFKMLKKSMESRFNVLRQLDQLKKNRSNDSNGTPR